MANRTTIKIKQSSVASNTPLASQLEQGELAINTADEKLYSKNSSGTVFEVGAGGDTGSGITEIDGGTSAALTSNLTEIDGGGA